MARRRRSLRFGIGDAGIARVNVLGVGISVINMQTALEAIERWIVAREKRYVCVVPVSSVMAAQRDETFKTILNNSGLSTPDGMPMVWLGRLHRFGQIDRVYGHDFMLALCKLSVRTGYRNFFYGEAQYLYDEIYCQRGEMENRIKEQQLDLFADRTSAHRFVANQFRLLLASAAYVLVEYIRRAGLANTELENAQCGTIRLKLFKLGARIVKSVRRIVVHIASCYPYAQILRRVSERLVPC